MRFNSENLAPSAGFALLCPLHIHSFRTRKSASSASSGSAHGHLVGAAHNGPGFLGGRRSQDRQVPDGPETRTLNTVAPVRRGATCGIARGAGGPGLLTWDSIMKPESEAHQAPTVSQGSFRQPSCCAAIPPPSKLSPQDDTLNLKQTPPALEICTQDAQHTPSHHKSEA